MNVKIENKPFPHIIIENYFTDDECDLIWREIDFLYSKFGPPETFFAAKDDDDTYITNSLGIALDDIYRDRKISDILNISNKIFNRELCKKFESKNEYWHVINCANKDYTKLRLYNESSSYDSHRDHWVNAIVSTTLSVDEFLGGHLYFPNQDFEIRSQHNKTVIFPGWIEHGITEIRKGSRFAITKFIHCAEVGGEDK